MDTQQHQKMSTAAKVLVPSSTAKSAAALLADAITEEELLTTIARFLELYKWRWCHFRPARTSKGWRTLLQGHRGLPDICAVRGTRLLFIELKSARGRLTPEQTAWLDALTNVRSAKVEVYTWTPARLLDGTVEGVLRA